MYVVTFYSFKGGVGRTMCLVNIASQLAQGGKKVLIADFDLEAPGIPTFELTAPKTEAAGLTEFITSYRSSGVAPPVNNFVYRAKSYESGGSIDVMPAGLHDAGYSSRLNSIDWVRLYSKEDGYVLFEDLKQQWQDTIAPDYVLIDSRTGHSDVEGICTRQLPDAVCFLFFPNEQNLQGLKRVVAGVRSENKSRASSRQQIALHFAVSNVPDLDDEDGIVGETLSRFKAQLGYAQLSGEIHHYDSLSLLNQVVFSEARPKSRLTREYRGLKEAIVRDNISDRDVALAFLRSTTSRFRTPGPGARRVHIDRVEQILAKFPSDQEIVLQVALVYEAIGRVSDALNLLSGDGDGTAHFYSIRARVNHRLGRAEEAAADLRRMLASNGAEVPALLDALSFAAQVDPQVFDLLPNSPAIRTLSPEDKLFVVSEIPDGPVELPAKAALLESILAEGADAEIVGHQLALALIGLGRFDRAVELLSPITDGNTVADLANVFNLAMAKLGVSGAADQQLFERVVDIDSKQFKRDADLNYLMCMAISNAILQRLDVARSLLSQCRAMLRTRPRREFSPWTYTKVSSKEILEHLLEIEQQLGSQTLRPRFSLQPSMV